MKIYFEGIDASASVSMRDDLLASWYVNGSDDDPEDNPKECVPYSAATDFWQSQGDIIWQPNCMFYQPSELYIHTYAS
jgi:hypothetical protein